MFCTIYNAVFNFMVASERRVEIEPNIIMFGIKGFVKFFFYQPVDFRYLVIDLRPIPDFFINCSHMKLVLPFKSLSLFALCFSIIGLVVAQTVTRLDKSTVAVSILDQKINTLVHLAKVHGLAITVFNNNEPVYSKTFGYKNIETKQTISPTTNFYGASLSKAVFGVLVMKLVEEKVLDLDKPLQDYLPKPIFEYTPTKKWHDNFFRPKKMTLYIAKLQRECALRTLADLIIGAGMNLIKDCE